MCGLSEGAPDVGEIEKIECLHDEVLRRIVDINPGEVIVLEICSICGIIVSQERKEVIYKSLGE